MALIEFLLRNYYLIFIAIFVFSMLKPRKQNQGNGQPGKQPGSMPPFGQGPGRTLARRGDTPHSQRPQTDPRGGGDPNAGRPATAQTLSPTAEAGRNSHRSLENTPASERDSRSGDHQERGRWEEQVSPPIRTPEVTDASGQLTRPYEPVRPAPRAPVSASLPTASRGLGELPTSDSDGDVPRASAEEVRRGLMWAEVLGAPRSRKPYQRR